MGDHHGKRRSTEKEIDLKDGKIKLYISINVYNENHLKNSNTNENESVVSTDVTNKVGDEEDEESCIKREHEKETKKTVDDKSTRLLNLINKSGNAGKKRKRTGSNWNKNQQ